MREPRSLVEVFLPVTERLLHRVRWWRNEYCVTERSALGTDPILGCPELSLCLVWSCKTLKKALMKFTHEPKRDRKRRETIQPVVEGINIIPHFSDLWTAHALGRFRGKHLTQTGLCSFDCQRGDRFSATVRRADQ